MQRKIVLTLGLLCWVGFAYGCANPGSLTGGVYSYVSQRCWDNNDGQVTFYGSGGNGNYLYAINFSRNYQISPSFVNLPPGNRTAYIKDTDNCTASFWYNIPAAPVQLFAFVEDVNDETCAGYKNGNVSFGTTGGVGGFNFSINGVDFQESNTFTNLAPSTSPIVGYARDEDNCIVTTESFDILPAAGTPITTSVSSSRNKQCKGSPDGYISFSNTFGGNGTYRYSLNDGQSQTQRNFTGLPAGEYRYSVRDSTCTANGTVTIDPPLAIRTTLVSTRNQKCSGPPDGTISFTNTSGGSGSYTYSINGATFQAQRNFTGFAAGVYRYAVADSGQCLANGTVTVEPPLGGITANVSSKNNIPNSSAGAVGNFTIRASGGVPPYLYSIDNKTFVPSNSFSNLGAGMYSVIVKDAGECSFVLSVEIVIVRAESCGNALCEMNNGESCATCIIDCGVCKPSPPSFESLYSSPLSGTTVIPTWPALNISKGDVTYIIDFRDDGLSQTYSTINRRYVISDLIPDTTYYIALAAQVQLNGSAYQSNFSDAVSVSTSGFPDSPTLLLSQYGRDYLVVTWGYPNDRRSNITSFFLSFSNSTGSEWKNFTIPNNATRRLRVDGLKINQTYQFRAQSFNYVGPSISNSSSFKTDSEFCGDGVCDTQMGENCESCFYDCPTCSYPACPGTPECSGQGKCNEGVCDCFAAYAGPSCSISKTVPIDFKNNTNNRTDVVIVPNLPNESTSFIVALTTIREIDSAGKIKVAFDLTSLPTSIQYLQTNISNSSVSQVIYNCSLPNRASLILSLYMITTGGGYTFANHSIVAPDNSVKYSIEVYNWPFLSIRNKLQIIIETEGNAQGDNSCKTNITSSPDGVKNLKWFAIDINGIILYAQFLENTLIDGKIGKVYFAFDETMKNVIVTVPAFWDNIYIDPVFSVLFDPISRSKFGSCNTAKKSSNLTAKVVGGVIGGVVGAAVLVGGAYAVYRAAQRKKTFDKISSSSNVQLNSM